MGRLTELNNTSYNSALAKLDPYGGFQIGGPLKGNEGRLDQLFEMLPGIGDYRALSRAWEAMGEKKLTPDLMGGATIEMPRKTEAALEALTAAPVVGDLATLGKMAAVGGSALIPMMMRRGGELPALAKAAKGQRGIIGSTGAKTADMDLLAKAQELKAAGHSADDIYAQSLPMDEASRMADNERMADIYDYDFPLTHESSSPDFDGTILERPSPSGVFDGVFSMEGLEGAAIGRGGYNHTYYPRKGRVAGPSDSDLDYDKSIDFLKKEFPGADNDEIDTLYELTAEDSNIYELFDDETMYRIRTGDITHPLSDFLPDDLGDASWELQNLRGKIAVSQDFDAIGMSDENGLSYFIPYGSKAKKK